MREASSTVSEPGLVPEERVVADLLRSLERDAHVSQRQLATELGVALGLINAYLKRCVKKGLIKVRRAPRRRYAYYLTPRGFAEKTRLTAEFLSWSLSFFRQARAQCGALMEEASTRGWRTLALLGASELAEIAILCAAEHGLAVAAVVDSGVLKPRIGGVPVYPEIASGLTDADGWIITGIHDAQALYDELALLVGPSRILFPNLVPIRAIESVS